MFIKRFIIVNTYIMKTTMREYIVDITTILIYLGLDYRFN